MRVRTVTMLLALAGCRQIFGIDDPRLADAGPPDTSDKCIDDDFFGAMIDASRWTTFVAPQIIVAQLDELTIDVGANATGEAGVRLFGTYDLTRATLEVEVARAVKPSPNTENYVRIRQRNDNSYGYVIRVSNGVLGFSSRVNSIYTRNLERQYDPTIDRFWQISNPDPDRIRFATRADTNLPWTEVVTVGSVVPFESLEIFLVAGSYNGGASELSVVSYDNFLLCGAIS